MNDTIQPPQLSDPTMPNNRINEISGEISGNELVELASFCEKDGLVHLDCGRIDRWLEKMETSEQQVDVLDRLWIYWVFGYPMRAKQMMALAVNDLERDKEGCWLLSESGKVVEDRPVGLLAHLKRKRTAKIEKFNTSFHNLISKSDDPSERKHDPISCRAILPVSQTPTALQEIRNDCRLHTMLQIYKMARPYFQQHLVGTWRESDVRVPGQNILSSIGEIADVINKMGVALRELDKEALEEWRGMSEEEAEKKTGGGTFDEASNEDSNKPSDHSHCVPRKDFCKLSLELLITGSILTRLQAEHLIEQEKTRSGAKSSKYSVEELLKEFEWPEGNIF